MFRPALVVVAAVAVGALLLSTVAFGRTGATTTLKGTVGPGFTISLKQKGKKVQKLKAGTYKFVISDKASIHNFTLEQEKGGKFEKDLTSVSFIGTKTVKVKLKRGKWKYYCTPHESRMFGFFKVT
jgi:Copper binding proteins, plastocyanin/azurin family